MSIDTIKASINVDEFDIVKTGNGSFATLSVSSSAGQYASGESITTIAHNLGYAPAFIVNISFLSGTTVQGLPCPYENNNLTASSGIWGILQAYTDNTNIYLLSDLMVYGNITGNITTGYVAQYYLLKERAKRII